MDTLPLELSFEVAFTHAGRTRLTTMHLGWLRIRLPEQLDDPLWMLVAQEEQQEQRAPLVLLTNVPLDSVSAVQAVYSDWRLRGRIEHGYHFDQEQGLDVEDMRVRTLEAMRRLFALVLLTACFVFHLMHTWPPQAVLWLRQLGGKLGRSIDRDGPYILLHGLQAFWHTVTTLSLLTVLLFPHDAFT